MSYIGENTIGKMYLGSTAIGKAYLGSDLVYDSAGGGQSEPTYIQNRLVFHLDGKDASSSQWVDKVGNIAFELHNTTIDNNGGVVFNGTNSYGFYTNELGYGYNSSTIEVVANIVGSGTEVLFMQCADNRIIAGLTSAGLCNRTTGSSGLFDFARGLCVLSTTGEVAYRNKSKLTFSPNTYFGYTTTGTFIGARDSTRNFFNGTIYQIRIYDRVLSVDEILYNQTIDINKYNIQ